MLDDLRLLGVEHEELMLALMLRSAMYDASTLYRAVMVRENIAHSWTDAVETKRILSNFPQNGPRLTNFVSFFAKYSLFSHKTK